MMEGKVSGRYEGVWSTDEINQAEIDVVSMTYGEAGIHLIAEKGFTIEMATALIGMLAKKYPKSRLAAHFKYSGLT